MYKHILLPTDGSIRSEKAITAGIELAKRLGAQVTALFVSQATFIDQIDNSPKPRAEAELAFAAEIAGKADVACNCVSLVGEAPAHSIIEYVTSNGCDLIIMGTHGRSRVGKLLLGSVAASVIADCEVPVLLYR
jgi:nucleotide-binding universal stress UspA family protein